MTSSCPEGLGLITNTSPFTCWCSLHATRIRLRRHSPPSPDLQIVGCCCCTHPHSSWHLPPPLRATWSWSWGWSLTSVGLCPRRRRPGSRGCLLTPWLKSYRAHGQYHRQVCHSMVMAARAGYDQLLPSTPDQLCFITGYWHRMVQGAGYRGCSREISRACRQSSSSESPGDLHCVCGALVRRALTLTPTLSCACGLRSAMEISLNWKYVLFLQGFCMFIVHLIQQLNINIILYKNYYNPFYFSLNDQ